jgi:hypothetical protein
MTPHQSQAQIQLTMMMMTTMKPLLLSGGRKRNPAGGEVEEPLGGELGDQAVQVVLQVHPRGLVPRVLVSQRALVKRDWPVH